MYQIIYSFLLEQLALTKFGIDTNGLALSAHLHTAFDNGLLGIDANYKVILSNNFKENKSSPLNLHQFEGIEILLPENPNYHPAQENLQWHRQEFGLMI